MAESHIEEKMENQVGHVLDLVVKKHSYRIEGKRPCKMKWKPGD